MVTPTDTRVIDPEFAMMGPIGFDLGAYLGNLLLSWYSQPGHAAPGRNRNPMRAWLLEQVEIFWTHFSDSFLSLWRTQAGGDAYPLSLFAAQVDRYAFEAERQAYMDALFADMIGFAACKMIRRLFGFAHVADFDSIADADARAAGEKNALTLARAILLEPQRFQKIGDIVAMTVQIAHR